MAHLPDEGEIVKGRVSNIVKYGAFVNLYNYDKDGLIHISEIANTYVKDVRDYLSVGEEVTVKVIGVDRKKEEISLSLKRLGKNKAKKKHKKKRNDKSKYKFLPKDTNSTIGDHDIENYALKLNKFISEFEKPKGVNGAFKVNNKEFLSKVAKRIQSDGLIDNIHKRNEAQIQSLKKAGYRLKNFTLKNDYRMVVGLGGANVLETNLTLHHVYGIPYIPGSSLKGLAKTWGVEKLREKTGINRYDLVDELMENDDFPEEIVAENNLNDYVEEIKLYREVFGTQKKAGRVIFFDSFPVSDINIKVDIMTPHFRDYYEEMEADNPSQYPTDYQEPIPIPFLVLEETEFKFRLAARNRTKKDKGDITSSQDEHLNLAAELLEEGLRNIGVGAKTMAGYGYFV